MAHNRPFMGTRLQPRQGIPAGLIAGLGMALVYGVFAALVGPGADILVNTVASTLQGPDVISSGWQLSSLLIGFVLHLVIAVLLGLLFASALDRLNRRDTLIVAGFYGFTIWVAASFIVGHWFNDAMLAFNRTWWGFLAHIAFGLCLGFYALWRSQDAVQKLD